MAVKKISVKHSNTFTYSKYNYNAYQQDVLMLIINDLQSSMTKQYRYFLDASVCNSVSEYVNKGVSSKIIDYKSFFANVFCLTCPGSKDQVNKYIDELSGDHVKYLNTIIKEKSADIILHKILLFMENIILMDPDLITSTSIKMTPTIVRIDLADIVSKNKYNRLLEEIDRMQDIKIYTESYKMKRTSVLVTNIFEHKDSPKNLVHLEINSLAVSALTYLGHGVGGTFWDSRVYFSLKRNNDYVKKFYWMCCSWVNLGNPSFYSIDEIRDLLGIPSQKYSRYSELKSKVLTVIIDLVMKESDFHIVMIERKQGRKVNSVKFIVTHDLKSIEESTNSIDGEHVIFNKINKLTKISTIEASPKLIHQFLADQKKSIYSIIYNKTLAETLTYQANVIAIINSPLRQEWYVVFDPSSELRMRGEDHNKQAPMYPVLSSIRKIQYGLASLDNTSKYDPKNSKYQIIRYNKDSLSRVMKAAWGPEVILWGILMDKKALPREYYIVVNTQFKG